MMREKNVAVDSVHSLGVQGSQVMSSFGKLSFQRVENFKRFGYFST